MGVDLPNSYLKLLPAKPWSKQKKKSNLHMPLHQQHVLSFVKLSKPRIGEVPSSPIVIYKNRSFITPINGRKING